LSSLNHEDKVACFSEMLFIHEAAWHHSPGDHSLKVGAVLVLSKPLNCPETMAAVGDELTGRYWSCDEGWDHVLFSIF
jgi:hypothetical protein